MSVAILRTIREMGAAAMTNHDLDAAPVEIVVAGMGTLEGLANVHGGDAVILYPYVGTKHGLTVSDRAWIIAPEHIVAVRVSDKIPR